MSKPNIANYGKLEYYLQENEIEYYQISPYQYRILGDVALVDVWPARMTVHVIQTEAVDPNRYFKLSYDFKWIELDNLLSGKPIKE